MPLVTAEEYISQLWEEADFDDDPLVEKYLEWVGDLSERLKLPVPIDISNEALNRYSVVILVSTLNCQCLDNLTDEQFEAIYPTLRYLTMSLLTNESANNDQIDKLMLSTLAGSMAIHRDPKNPDSQIAKLVEEEYFTAAEGEWLQNNIVFFKPTIH